MYPSPVGGECISLFREQVPLGARMQPAGAKELSSRHLHVPRSHRGPASAFTQGSDRPFVRDWLRAEPALKAAAVLPGISHRLVTQALAQSIFKSYHYFSA